MRISLSNMPNQHATKMVDFPWLDGGLNLWEMDYRINRNQSPEMKNLWWQDGVLQCRDGQSYLYGPSQQQLITPLPEDFWSLRTGGVSVIRDGKFRRTNQFRLQGRKYILVPGDDSYTVEYYRYPVQLPLDNTLTDDYEVEEDPEVIQTATYYASAYLVLQEDEFAFATLYNDYESRLGRISPGITAEVQPIEDSYGTWGYET